MAVADAYPPLPSGERPGGPEVPGIVCAGEVQEQSPAGSPADALRTSGPSRAWSRAS